jgi:hypothetical protein
VRPEERERVRPDREIRLPVVGEHALPAREVGELRRLRGGIERKRELLRLSARALDRSRPGREAELPQEVAAPRTEAVARSAPDERLERVTGDLRAAGEVADVPERPVRLPLGLQRLRVVLSDRRDVRQPDTDGV